MRKFLLAAVAAGAIASPALATDNAPYVGIEGGLMFPKSRNIYGTVNFTDPAFTDIASTQVARERYKTGYDVDLIGGYDMGMFRLEGELGYKRAKAKNFTVNQAFVTALNAGGGTTYTTGTDFGLSNHVSVYSAMLNGLVDLGGVTGMGLYAGAGAGYASVKDFGHSDGKFAWQLIAGASAPISGNLDLGLKYRYFHAGRSNGTESYAFAAGAGPCGTVTAPVPCSGGVATFTPNGRFTSHSLLASLVYNFAAPVAPVMEPVAPPPPPPVEAPATQTCPDGSVILATSACPAPPPPPPPAPVERGERG